MPVSFDCLDQNMRPNFERFCDRHDIHESDVSLSPLNASNVIPVEAREFCQLFLGELALKTQPSNRVSDRSFRVARHTTTLKAIRPMRYTL